MGLRERRRICCFTFVKLISTLFFTINLTGYSEAAPRTETELSQTTDTRPSHYLEATVVSFGLLITLVIFIMLCSGGCCLNVFGRRRGEIETRGFDNPVAALGESATAVPMSPIDVRALTLDPIVFEPLPSINILTPSSTNFYNSLPRIERQLDSLSHPQNNLRQTTVDSPSSQHYMCSVQRSRTEGIKSDNVVCNNEKNVNVESRDEQIQISTNSSQWVTFSSSSNELSIINEKKFVGAIAEEPSSSQLLTCVEGIVLNTLSSDNSSTSDNFKSGSQFLGISVTVTAPTPENNMSVNDLASSTAIPPIQSLTTTSSPESSLNSSATSNNNNIKNSVPESNIVSISCNESVVISDDSHESVDVFKNCESDIIMDIVVPQSLQNEDRNKIQEHRKVRPMFRKTSTPNHSPEHSSDGTVSQVHGLMDSKDFFLRNEDVFEDFSMELTCRFSPIEKNAQADREWQPTLCEHQSLVTMGADDEYELRPYQRVTTELENDSNFQLGIEEVESISFKNFDTSSIVDLTLSGTFDTVLDQEYQKEVIVPRKLNFDDTSLLESSTGSIIDDAKHLTNGHSWVTVVSSQEKELGEDDAASGPAGFTFLEELDVTPFANNDPDAPATAIKPTTMTSNEDSSQSLSKSTENKTESSHEGSEETCPSVLFKLGERYIPCISSEDGLHEAEPSREDKFVEDIKAATEEMGSLVLTDFEEDIPTVKVVKETREDEVESYTTEGIGIIQRGNLFENVSVDGRGEHHELIASDAGHGPKTTEALETSVEDEGNEISYLALNNSVEIVKEQFENSRTFLVSHLDDSDIEDESICRDFVPSKWNQNLAPVKPAISQRSQRNLRSPEQQSITNATNESSSDGTFNGSKLENTSSLKKSVSFERKKTQLVYEYPPPCPSDSDEEDKHAARSLAVSGGHFNLSLDWELQPEELEHQSDVNQDDWDDEHLVGLSIRPRTDNPMDMYRISGFDNFQVRPSKEPFFQSVPVPPPRQTFPSSSSSLSSTWTSSSSLLPSGLGELRHTRERLKLDLSKGEASLLDSEGSDKSSAVKQQIDSGVGSSSTNVSPFL